MQKGNWQYQFLKINLMWKHLCAYNIYNFVGDNQEECEYHWHNGQIQHG